jgi:signal transduction histidine kinase
MRGGERGGAVGDLTALRLSSLAVRVFVVGTLLSVGVWGLAAYRFSGELARAEARNELVARRYSRAQDALTALRAAALRAEYGRQYEQFPPPDDSQAPLLTLTATLREYVPIWDSPSEQALISRLRREIEAPQPVSLVAISDDLQSLNRAMFLAEETGLRATSRRVETKLHRGLNTALLLSLGVCLVAAVYSTRLESRLARQRADEVRYTSDLQRLSARVVAVQEEERRTIALELHDEVGQSLAAIKVELAAADRLQGDRGAGALVRARAIADDALRNVREISHLLHPPMLEQLGLVHALEHLGKEFSRRHDVRVSLDVEGAFERLRPDTEQAVYRIVQEALTNVAKHAHARSCRVSLAQRAEGVIVTIADDGVGFGALGGVGSLPQGEGLGLVGIRERAACFNGTVAISNGGNGGGTVSVMLSVG